MDIFQELNKKGRTIVLITHDLILAEHAKRVISIADGKIVSKKQVANPKDAMTTLENMSDN